MERMTGADAGFLYMETPSMHMHTLKVPIITPRDAFDFDEFVERLGERMDRLPPMRRRVVNVPGMLNHPMWVEDRHVDPAQHVFLHELPAPAGQEQFEDLIGAIASTGLKRDRPLWEMHVAEMADGRVGVATKMHHALADGNAANALLANVVDAIDRPVPPPPPPLDETPAKRTMVFSALWEALLQVFTLPALLGKTFKALRNVVTQRKTSEVATPRPILDAPRTSFNGPLTPRRSFATVSLPLADFKQIRVNLKDTTDPGPVTLNDVVLAITGGALRAWLAEHGEVVNGSLIAGVPVGTDEPGAPARLAGNKVSNLFTTLATDRPEPLQRLKTVSRTTVEAKKMQQALGKTMLADWVQFTPPAPFSAIMRAYSRSRAAAYHSAPFNVVVSNVPGLREQVTIHDAVLSDFYSVGPILEGIGLNVTVWSYIDRMNFSFLACPDLLPDVRGLIAHMGPALAELLEASESA